MTTAKLEAFLKNPPGETPFLVVDIDLVAQNYQRLHQLFPKAEIYYAVKANPEPEVLQCLLNCGSAFDAASIFEVQQCLALGIQPEQISYGNPIKKAKDIAAAYALGVRLFSFDSAGELEKLARYAPGAQVLCRLRVETQGADWSLSHKFGCDIPMAYDLLAHAQRTGLHPAGVTFHVGSQQTDPSQWEGPIQLAADLFAQLKRIGIELTVLNLGGGFPAHYRSPVPSEATYAEAIQGAITRHFGPNRPRIMLEPGRSLVGDAGILNTEVVLIAKKSYSQNVSWVFLDVGKFNGLIETLDECIKYRIRTPYDESPQAGLKQRVILAGPTCDSADILYEDAAYELPAALQVGDQIQILSTGAYTHTYASVGFNGFPSIQIYCI